MGKLVEEINIENFKSIEKLRLELGQVNVFIGENGAGKSNVLEAIAFAAATAAEKTDNEFLAARGIRVSRPELMRSAFKKSFTSRDIKFGLKLDTGLGEANNIEYRIGNDNEPYSNWKIIKDEAKQSALKFSEIPGDMEKLIPILHAKNENSYEELSQGEIFKIEVLKKLLESIQNGDIEFERTPEGDISIDLNVDSDTPNFISDQTRVAKEKFGRFVIFSPENSALRILESEGQIVPLGINGEGLLQFLSVLAKSKSSQELKKIKSALSLFGWFSDMKVGEGNSKYSFKLKDNYLDSNVDWMDQRSANEGFLFAAFYFSLFSSKLTPSFFAVDNIDASLNPRLCQELMSRLTVLAKENEKQAILTTHNPAILDGLDLNDPEQRLFVVSRDRNGKTRVRRYDKPRVTERKRLSELFINGLLGGLPKGF